MFVSGLWDNVSWLQSSAYKRISRSVGFTQDGLPALNYPVLKLKLVSMSESFLMNFPSVRIWQDSDEKIGAQPIDLVLQHLRIVNSLCARLSHRTIPILQINTNRPLAEIRPVFGQFQSDETGKDKDGNINPSVVAYWFAWGKYDQNTR